MRYGVEHYTYATEHKIGHRDRDYCTPCVAMLSGWGE